MTQQSYVYELIDPRDGEPFYVGKGVGDRAYAHLRPVANAGNPAKQARIAEIRDAGYEPEVSVVAFGLTNAEAVALERDRIATVGLPHLTNQSTSTGPAPDPDALHAQLKDGRGAHLHAVIPDELHRRLKVRSAMTGVTLSQMVAEAVAAYLVDDAWTVPT